MSDGYRAQPLAPDSEAESHGELLGWYNTTMHAAMWLKRASVKPDEAAMLLCRIDPLERDWQGYPPDPERIYVDDDKASPDRYRLLLRVFLDVAENDPKSRTLLDWRGVAKREGLQCHEWIDEYVQALPAEAGGKSTKTTPSLTEIRIEAIVEAAKQHKYNPLSVATGGKAIIKAECLDKLKGAPHHFTADTFKKAWQAARDAGRIDVENVEIYRGQ